MLCFICCCHLFFSVSMCTPSLAPIHSSPSPSQSLSSSPLDALFISSSLCLPLLFVLINYPVLGRDVGDWGDTVKWYFYLEDFFNSPSLPFPFLIVSLRVADIFKSCQIVNDVKVATEAVGSRQRQRQRQWCRDRRRAMRGETNGGIEFSSLDGKV